MHALIKNKMHGFSTLILGLLLIRPLFCSYVPNQIKSKSNRSKNYVQIDEKTEIMDQVNKQVIVTR